MDYILGCINVWTFAILLLIKCASVKRILNLIIFITCIYMIIRKYSLIISIWYI